MSATMVCMKGICKGSATKRCSLAAQSPSDNREEMCKGWRCVSLGLPESPEQVRIGKRGPLEKVRAAHLENPKKIQFDSTNGLGTSHPLTGVSRALRARNAEKVDVSRGLRARGPERVSVESRDSLGSLRRVSGESPEVSGECFWTFSGLFGDFFGVPGRRSWETFSRLSRHFRPEGPERPL